MFASTRCARALSTLRLALGAVSLLALSSTPAAQDEAAPDAGETAEDAGEAQLEFDSWPDAMGVTPITGTVTLGGELAEIALPEGWSFLNGGEGRFFVEEVWGNPPDESTLGFAYPTGSLEELPDWGVIVSFEEGGYVEDDDASSIDYDEMMQAMKDEAEASNEARKQAGYGTVDIIGWAEQPHYDAASKKLYWAKDLVFDDSEIHTVNYDVRVLGRRGVLSMNAVADLTDLDEVRAGSRELLAGTQFLPGHRYEEFDPSIDKVAAYGIGGLIAGKALLKGGFLAKLGLIFAKFSKVLIVGAVAVLALFGRLFGRKQKAA